MRLPITLVFGLLCMGMVAQNWALINPAYKYNFSNDGSDTISNQIFVTHIDTLGVDSLAHRFGLLADHCAPCLDAPIGCDGTEGLFIDRPQFLGAQAVQLGADWYLVGADSLLVRPGASSGESWSGPGGVVGTVTLGEEQTVFGQLDSLKTIDYSDGRSITISKAFGLQRFFDSGTSYALIGIQGGASHGEHLPTIADLYDYQPGDILQYQGTLQGTDGMCYHQTLYTRKFTVLVRSDLPGRTDYSLRRVYDEFNWGQPVVGGWDCGGYSVSGVDTVLLSIEHDRWTEGNFLGNSWLDQLWPGAFGLPGDPLVGQGEFGANDRGIRWSVRRDAEQRYVFEPEQFDPANTYFWPAFTACDQDPAYFPFQFDNMFIRYVEGIGRVKASYLLFEHSAEEELIGSVIGGNVSGTVSADDIILGTSERIKEAGLLFPNPANDHIACANMPAGSVVRLIDLHGRTVLTLRTRGASEVIDVADLAPGVYVAVVANSSVQRLVIAR